MSIFQYSALYRSNIFSACKLNATVNSKMGDRLTVKPLKSDVPAAFVNGFMMKDWSQEIYNEW